MSKDAQDVIKRRDEERELRFLQHIADRLPEDTEVMRALADLYTRTGKMEEGLRLDEQLSQLCSEDPLVWYNLGCSFALTQRKDDALEALGRAIEIGYDDYEWMKKDSDLASLRGDPRFESMLDWIYSTFIQAAD